MEYQNLVIITVFILAYSLFSKPIEKSIVNGALLATIFGIIAGPMLLSIFHVQLDNSDYRLIAELALALVLYTDAAKTNMNSLSLDARLPSDYWALVCR